MVLSVRRPTLRRAGNSGRRNLRSAGRKRDRTSPSRQETQSGTAPIRGRVRQLPSAGPVTPVVRVGSGDAHACFRRLRRADSRSVRDRATGSGCGERTRAGCRRRGATGRRAPGGRRRSRGRLADPPGRASAPATCCSSRARPPRSASMAGSPRSMRIASTALASSAPSARCCPRTPTRNIGRRASPTRRTGWPGVGRFRINLHRERGRAAAAIRALPTTVPRLASLNLPPGIEQLSRLTRGLVLVGGPTGSGKSTTLAAIVDEINRREARHVVTIEDPIEYEHAHRQSLVEQVEIGIDAPDFPTALRAALRQAPDVIVVGEMRDPETMRIALVGGRDRAPRALERPHDGRGVDRVPRRRLVSARAPEHDPPGAVDGAGGDDDAAAAAQDRRRASPGRGAADGRATARVSTSGRTRSSTSTRRSRSRASTARSRSRSRWQAWSAPASWTIARHSHAPAIPRSSSGHWEGNRARIRNQDQRPTTIDQRHRLDYGLRAAGYGASQQAFAGPVVRSP